jgi:manganese/zinc/iron transport system permease protein
MPLPPPIDTASPWLAADLGNLGMHAWAAATAAVVSASCAVVGTLLVVRRMSLFGDAISHAVLPGIAVAVLAGGRPGGPAVFLGAVAAALLTVWLAQGLRVAGGLAEDAGAGVAFTTLFAVGVVIVTAYASRIDIDASCVLYGILELVPFDTVTIWGVAWPRAFLTGTAVLIALAVALACTWNMQVFTAFDADAARAAGVPVVAVTTGLLTATAVATVAGFEAVGAILVVAMLVVPAAAAELLTQRLHHMVVVAVLLGMTGAVAGYLAAWIWNTSAAGMIAVALGLEYVAAAVLAPDGGLVARLVSRGRLGWRVACEDRLALAWRNEEASGDRPRVRPRRPLEAMAGWWLAAAGRMDRAGALTAVGRREAELVVRSHRLWEAWLGRHAELPLDHLHPPAEWVEHHLGAEVRRRLEADLGREASDPHGREIPPES